jgi:hypothetical protein
MAVQGLLLSAVFLGPLPEPAAAAPLNRRPSATAHHNCGGHRCWDNRRHHGHSRYHRDAGDHVSFRLLHKKF